MGTVLSMCGLGEGHEVAEHFQEFEREKEKFIHSSERSRSVSVSADTSVASILSHSDRLIPDAYAPVDIQVLSRGRRRSNNNSGGNTPSRSGFLSSSSTFLRNSITDAIPILSSSTADRSVSKRNMNVDSDSLIMAGSVDDVHGDIDIRMPKRNSRQLSGSLTTRESLKALP
ncbi:TPA: hypothetical protein N0F65_008457 [Lagenidium giganteum]|uniref:Uncharacterized protein n=1 Tax=Lagenidium giganteum TaxID=4803 RepID=A0AAV2YRB5_9STRA|nr:TPA: hypothetical protein N0F65_008457 [Lagenidium giganteum]